MSSLLAFDANCRHGLRHGRPVCRRRPCAQWRFRPDAWAMNGEGGHAAPVGFHPAAQPGKIQVAPATLTPAAPGRRTRFGRLLQRVAVRRRMGDALLMILPVPFRQCCPSSSATLRFTASSSGPPRHRQFAPGGLQVGCAAGKPRCRALSCAQGHVPAFRHLMCTAKYKTAISSMVSPPCATLRRRPHQASLFCTETPTNDFVHGDNLILGYPPVVVSDHFPRLAFSGTRGLRQTRNFHKFHLVRFSFCWPRRVDPNGDRPSRADHVDGFSTFVSSRRQAELPALAGLG